MGYFYSTYKLVLKFVIKKYIFAFRVLQRPPKVEGEFSKITSSQSRRTKYCVILETNERIL